MTLFHSRIIRGYQAWRRKLNNSMMSSRCVHLTSMKIASKWYGAPLQCNGDWDNHPGVSSTTGWIPKIFLNEQSPIFSIDWRLTQSFWQTLNKGVDCTVSAATSVLDQMNRSAELINSHKWLQLALLVGTDGRVVGFAILNMEIRRWICWSSTDTFTSMGR